MSTKRKLITGCIVCLLSVMLLTIICLPAVFAKDEDKFVYELQDDYYVIKDIRNNFRDGWFGKEKLVVPATHNNKKVVALEKIESSCLRELVISEGIETIAPNALTYNVKMSKVTLPNSLKTLGANALARTAITSVTIPSSVTNIEDGLFSGCSSLASITIPNSVTSIGNEVFEGCSGLTGITIPNSVTSIGNNTFENCNNLTSITIPNSVTSIGDNLFANCSNLASITIPNSVTSIGNNVFVNCNSLTNIAIPNSVTNIGNNAFENCNILASITLPDSVTSLANNAFKGCSNLANITLPDGISAIGYSAFENTAYYNNTDNWENDVLYIGKCLIVSSANLTEEYTIKDETKIIADNAFSGRGNLASITIPNSVTSIGNNVFVNCNSLTNIAIPNSVTSIGNNAFKNCNILASITLPDSVTDIGNNAFKGCSKLADITLPDGISAIGYSAFENTAYYKNTDNWENDVLYIGKCLIVSSANLAGEYTIKDETKIIADNAFSGRGNLTSIILPDSVTSLGNSSFDGCKKLKNIQYGGTVAQWEAIVKDTDWNKDMEEYTIHCTDGDIEFKKEK